MGSGWKYWFGEMTEGGLFTTGSGSYRYEPEDDLPEITGKPITPEIEDEGPGIYTLGDLLLELYDWKRGGRR